MKLARCRPTAVLLLALHVSACTYWQPTTVAPRQLIAEERPSTVRVTKIDGEQVALRAPELRGDSLVDNGARTVSTAVALSDIQAIEVRRFGLTMTLGLIALIGVASLVAAFVAAEAELNNS